MQGKLPWAAVLSVLLPATAVQAHFVWIDAPPTAGGQHQVQVWFSETPAPGDADLLAKIAQTKAWIRRPDATPTPVELKASTDAKVSALVGEQPVVEPASLEAQCDYGVFSRGPKPLLLHYYAKHLAMLDGKVLPTLARAEGLALDIVPQNTDSGLTLNVLWKGQPAPNLEIAIYLPGGDEPKKLVTDAQGRVTLEPGVQGRVAARVRLLEPDRKGEHLGKAYDGALHYSTLTMELAMNPPTASNSQSKADAELTAPALLERARLARSTWKNFPGFRARLAVEAPGFRGAGRLTVTADGDVKLADFPAGFDAAPIQSYLESLVQHRLADTGADENVEYVAESQTHPLGRLIRFIGDEKLQSTYRVRDDMVTEVNRVMDDMRFGIAVVDVQRDAAGKYLPAVFTVNFWDKASGALRRTETHVNHWLSVGHFSLPRAASIVRASSEGSKVTKLEFSQQELLAGGSKP